MPAQEARTSAQQQASTSTKQPPQDAALAPAEQGRIHAQEALSLMEQRAGGDDAVRAASLHTLQATLAERMGSTATTLGLGTPAARVVLGTAVVMTLYGLVDQANGDIKTIPAHRTPWRAVASAVGQVSLMSVGVAAMIGIQDMAPAPAVASALMHRSFAIKLREAVCVWHGGRSFGEGGLPLWWAVVSLTWITGYIFGNLGPNFTYAFICSLAAATVAAKYFTWRCAMRKALTEHEVRMPALRCPACSLQL